MSWHEDTTMRLLLFAIATTAVLASALSSAPAGAQISSPGVPPTGSAGSTVDGGHPEKTGATTAVGQTKPPGGVLDDRAGTTPDLDQKSRDIDRQINTGICSGCK